MNTHFAQTVRKFRRAIPEGSPSGLVSIDVECLSPFWYAVQRGEWQPGYIQRVGAWRFFVDWLLREDAPMQFALYGWPSRMRNPQYLTTYRAATDAIAPLLTEFDVVTPSLYDPAPGEIVSDTRALFIAMTETTRLVEKIDRPSCPQLTIRHKGQTEFVELDEFTRQLDMVLRFNPAARIEGVALWSGANNEHHARATSLAMHTHGFADVLSKRLVG